MAYTCTWLEGTRAFVAKKEKTANPYPYLGTDYMGWNEGWDDAAVIVDPLNPNIGKLLEPKQEMADV